MLAAVSELNAGYNDPTVNWLYRHHATQLSRQENWWHAEVSDKALVIQRVHALRNGRVSKNPWPSPTSALFRTAVEKNSPTAGGYRTTAPETGPRRATKAGPQGCEHLFFGYVRTAR
jgi:hypothetical protein